MTQNPQEYWNSFYVGSDRRAVPTWPSSFARWSTQHVPRGDTIWEFGFGNARDSLWLAAQGYVVRGFDFADSAVQQANYAGQEQRLDTRFQHLDLNDDEQVAEFLRGSPRRAGRHMYGRFLIHSIEDSARHNLFKIAGESLAAEGYLLLEFRTNCDAESQHLFGNDHFRTYLDPDLVVDELVQRGATIRESVQGFGMAVYKTEDPHVARIVAHWDTE